MPSATKATPPAATPVAPQTATTTANAPVPAPLRIPARLAALSLVERRPLIVYGPTLFRTPEAARKVLLKCVTGTVCGDDLRDVLSTPVVQALSAASNEMVLVAWPHFYDSVAWAAAAPGVYVSAAASGAKSPLLTRYRVNTRWIVKHAGVHRAPGSSVVLDPLPYERACALLECSDTLHEEQAALFPLDIPSALSLAQFASEFGGTGAVLMCGFDDDDSAKGHLDFLSTALGRFVSAAGLRQTHRYWAACSKLSPESKELEQVTKHMFQKLIPSTAFVTVAGRWTMVRMYEGTAGVRARVADPSVADARVRSVLLGACWKHTSNSAHAPVNEARWLLADPPTELVSFE